MNNVVKRKGMKTVLIADEDSAIRGSIGSLFTDLGYRVVHVSSGADAISKSREMKPDIILVDVSLPNGDGYEVSGKIKGDPALEYIPVILIASSLGVFDEVKAAGARADDFLIKPLKSERIIKKVESLINQYERREIGSIFNSLSHTEVVGESDGFEMLNEYTIYKEPLDYGSYKESDCGNGTEEVKIQQEVPDSDDIILLEEECESQGEAGYNNDTKEIKIEPGASGLNEEIILLEEELIEQIPNTESDAKKIEALDEKSKTEIVVESVLKEEIKKIK